MTESNTNKKRKERIPNHVKEEVWKRYGGPVCWCCQKQPITAQNKHYGHIQAEKNGGKAIVENLRPVCPSCNLRMRTKNMYDFMSDEGYPLRDSASIYRIVNKDPELIKALHGKHIYAIPVNDYYDYVLSSTLLTKYSFLKIIYHKLNILFESSKYQGITFHYVVKPDYVKWIKHHIEKPEIEKIQNEILHK
jgi:hypothetical protein